MFFFTFRVRGFVISINLVLVLHSYPILKIHKRLFLWRSSIHQFTFWKRIPFCDQFNKHFWRFKFFKFPIKQLLENFQILFVVFRILVHEFIIFFNFIIIRKRKSFPFFFFKTGHQISELILTKITHESSAFWKYLIIKNTFLWRRKFKTNFQKFAWKLENIVQLFGVERIEEILSRVDELWNMSLDEVRDVLSVSNQKTSHFLVLVRVDNEFEGRSEFVVVVVPGH